MFMLSISCRFLKYGDRKKAAKELRVSTVYLLIYRTAKNNYFGNCPGIIGTDFYRACEVSGIIKTSKQLHAS